MIKTPITVLQEMMIKLGLVPQYECVSQSGPQHQVLFEYRCTVNGAAASGLAHSKKEAKQDAARHMLQVLNGRGTDAPLPHAPRPGAQLRAPSSPSPTTHPALQPEPSAAIGCLPSVPPDTRSYVALLKELCEKYRLGGARYELIDYTGPDHRRHFTIRATLGPHSRQCTSTTKKEARQQAAKQLYKYLRDNLSTLTGVSVEENAFTRALEKSLAKEKESSAGNGIGAAMERYTDLRGANLLGQRTSEYRLDERDERKRESVLEAAAGARETERALREECGALGLRVEAGAYCGADVSVLRLVPSAPQLVFAGRDRAGAARVALRYLRRGLYARRDVAWVCF